MVRVRRTGEAFKAEAVFDMKKQRVEQRGTHADCVIRPHVAVGKKKRGLFTCLSLEGKEVWTSEGKSLLRAGQLYDGRRHVSLCWTATRASCG